jgi:hypothetical protein
MLDTPALPGRDDTITLFPHDDDPSDGPTTKPRNRYWHADGTITIDLERMFVDPTEERQRNLQGGQSRHRFWWTDNSGDLGQKLLAGGWRPHH